MKKIVLLFVFFTAIGLHLSAQKQVSGKITDSDGMPLPGVSVAVKGTTTATMSSTDGGYTITVPQRDSVYLVYSFIGMVKQKILVGSKNTINVVLEEQTVDVGNVVVTAIGVTKSEKNIGYAATTVESEEITETRNRSALNALSGKVAGVQITQASGAPGSSTRTIFRGFSSFNGSNQPLFVVDGVPINNSASGSTSLNGGTDFGNGANDINPDDIKTMNFLKGSAATALYGSRAANGVVVITTKKGKSNRAKGTEITVSSSMKFSTPLRLPLLQNVYGQGIFGNWDQRENTSYGPKFDDELHYWGHNVNGERLIKPYSALPDNLADFFDVGRTLQNSISMAGGNEAASYFLSYSNVNDDGIMPYDRDTYNRNTIGLRGTANFTNDFKSTASINYINKTNKFVPTGQGGQSVWNNVLQQPRDIPVLDLANYKDKFYDKDTYYSPYTTNPYWPLLENGNKNNEDRVYGMAELAYQPNPHFSAMFRTGTDVSNRQTKEWRAIKINKTEAEGGFNEGVNTEYGQVEEYTVWNSQLNTDFIMTYNRKFGDFDVNLLAGHNMNQSTYRNQYTAVQGLDVEGFYHLSNSYGTPAVSQYSQQKRIIGVYGNASVNYKGWLNLEISDRNDWSSTLPLDNNSFNYPGVSMAFVYSDAFESIKGVIPYGKLRASWGKTGNDANLYQVYPVFSQPGRFPLPSNTNAFTKGNRVGNPLLQPEMTTELELGTDVRFWNGRIQLDLTVYDKTITDMIFNVELAASSGYTYQTRNLGEMNHKGIEILLKTTPIKKDNFQWNLDINFSKNISNLVRLNPELGLEHVDLMGLLGGTEHWFRAYPGKPVAVFESSKPDVYVDADGVEHPVVDSQGIPKLASEGYVDSGKSEHDYTMNVANSFTFFKYIRLSASVDYRQGGVMHSRTAGMVYFTGTSPVTLYNDRQPFIVPNSVRQVGTDDEGNPIYVENTQPVLYEVLGGSAASYMDRGGTLVGQHEIIDKTFVKLRSMALTLKMPKKWLNRVPFGSVSFSVVGRNLLLWTPKENIFIDPELTTYGNDITADFGEFGATPSVRTIGFNLSVKF